MTRLDAPLLEPNQIVLVAVLRAGSGLLDGLLGLVPDAAVGFVGLRRDEATLKPDTYYVNLPPTLERRHVICCDHAGNRRVGGPGHRAAQVCWRQADNACLPARRAGRGGAYGVHPS